ncbi:hypothetical protein ABIA39_007186 [Nocardia sp. GAS34]
MTYIRREHFVDIIVDSASRVEAYSVVSCSPDFTPTLTAPDGSIVSLNSTPLAHAQTATGETSDETTDSLNNGRYLSYFPGKSGTSTTVVFRCFVIVFVDSGVVGRGLGGVGASGRRPGRV